MPIYTYQCPLCDKVEDILVPMEQRNDRIVHSCGSAMVRQMSLPLPPIIRRTGKGMALDSLNSGNTFPNRYYKQNAEKMAAAGLEKPAKRVW